MTADPSQPAHADHRPYIETVRVALLLKDVQVGNAVYSTGRVRAATMPLAAPDDDADDPWHFTFASTQFVELHWNEEDGWSLLALHACGDALLPTIWRRGFGVLLQPEEVAVWIDLLLVMPSASASREDGPYCSHQTHDPAFEAALSAYAL
jgi:hypothetical protein